MRIKKLVEQVYKATNPVRDIDVEDIRRRAADQSVEGFRQESAANRQQAAQPQEPTAQQPEPEAPLTPEEQPAPEVEPTSEAPADQQWPPEPVSEADAMRLAPAPTDFEPGRPSAKDPAGRNINLDWLETTDSIDAVIAEQSRMAGENIEARRGTISHEETQRQAEDVDALNLIIGRKVGTAHNAEEITAMRNLMVDRATELQSIAERVANENVDEATLLMFRQKVSEFNAIQSHVAGATAEAGRALNAFRIRAAGGKAQVHAIRRILDDFGGTDTVIAMAERIQHADGEVAIAQAVREISVADSSDMVIEYWINNLLSGPKTHFANFVGNSIAGGMAIADRATAAAWSHLLKTPDGVQAGEAIAQMFGMVHALREGAALGLRQAFKDEHTYKVMAPGTKLEGRQHSITASAASQSRWGKALGITEENRRGKAFDLFGKALRVPGRVLNAGDVMARVINYRMELYAQAYREAAGKGLFGEAFDREVQGLVRNPTEEIHLTSDAAADYNTFQTDLGDFGRGSQRLMSQWPMMRLTIPFMKTPVNIAKWTYEHTPGPLVMDYLRKDKGSKGFYNALQAGGPTRDLALAKVSTGSAILATAGLLAGEGVCVGSLRGPVGKAYRRKGVAPYSCKIGDKWFTYSRLDPMGMLFGLSADMHEMVSGMPLNAEEDDPTIFDLSAVATLAVARNFSSKTYLQGLSDMLEALQSQDSGKMQRIMERYPSTFVPYSSAVRTVTQANDPYIRRFPQIKGGTNAEVVFSVMDRVIAEMPWNSGKQANFRNLWGDIIDRRDSGRFHWLLPIAATDERRSKVDDEIIENEISMRMPKAWIGSGKYKTRMTPQEYDRFIYVMSKELKDSSFAGIGEAGPRNMKATMEAFMRTTQYQNMSKGPDGTRAKKLKSILGKFADGARKYARAGKPGFEDFKKRMLKNEKLQYLALTGEDPDAI